MKKRTLPRWLCCLMALALMLTLCPPAIAARAEAPYAEYVDDPSVTYTISWYCNQPNGPTPDDAPIKRLLEERFNVKFDLVYVDRADRDEIISTRIASGEFPDVMTASDPTLCQEYYKHGLTAELPIGLIEHFMPTIAQCIQDVGEQEGISPYVYTSYEGKNIGLPNFNYIGRYHYTSLYRNDWLEALGIDKMPETIEEMDAAFRILKDNKQKLIDAGLTKQPAENIYGLSSGRIKEPFASIYSAYGAIPYYWGLDENGNVAYGAIQPGMKDALQQLAAWYADGILNPEFITGENRGDHWSISHDFVEGRILYTNNAPFYQDMPAGISALTPAGGKMYKAYMAYGNTEESYGVGRPPIGPDGSSGSVVWGNTRGDSVVFSAKLMEDKGKLARVLTMIEETSTSPEYYELFYYGIEGEHFIREEDGTRTILIPEDELLETYGLGTVFVSWGEGLGLCVADDPNYYVYGDQVARYSNNYKDLLQGMSLPSSDIFWDDLEKMRIQAYNDIIQGIKPVEYFDTFVTEWLEAGGEIMTAEANAWYHNAIGQ